MQSLLIILPNGGLVALLLLPGAVELVPLPLLEVARGVELGAERPAQHPPRDQGRRLGTGTEWREKSVIIRFCAISG